MGKPRPALAYLLAAFLLSSMASRPEASGIYPDLFGAQERRADTVHLFPQWTGTLQRYFAERELAEGSCRATRFNRCHLREWQAFLQGVGGLDRMTQLRRINEYMNRAHYIIDPINYGVPDYWATPREFLQNEGDCEDYAISKYLSLRALGWPPAMLRVLVLQDENLHVGHAVLVVYFGGTAYILDNQTGEVVDHRRIRHYRPIYSLNENSWWIHRR